MDTHEGLRLAKRFADALRARGYPVLEAFLFGSVAKGTADADSDIDIAVVCEPFAASRGEESTRLLLVSKDIDRRIETVCLHPEDFDNRYSTLVEEVKRYGIPASAVHTAASS